MSDINDERWSCPVCGRTVTVYASPADTEVARRAVQCRHAEQHRRAAKILRTLPLPKKSA